MERPGQALKFSILLVASSLTASLAIASEVEEAREGSLRASLLGNLEWRNIGPGMTSGRIAHIAVVEDDTRIIYAATATGGLWKTVNNGTTWKPVFEKEGTLSLGAVAVARSNPNIVWVAPVRISTPGATPGETARATAGTGAHRFSSHTSTTKRCISRPTRCSRAPNAATPGT